MTDTYQMAGTVFAVDSLYREVHSLCKAYRSTAQPEFVLKINTEDIAYERERSANSDRKEGIPVRSFPDSYLETLAVYRKLCEKLIEKDILLFHGSVVAVDGIAYLFTAKSGTGKSTHTRLWREVFGERAVMINDDKPLLQIRKSNVIVYGTPYDGKHHLSTNQSAPLRAICCLKRGAENQIYPISKEEAYPMLLQQTHRPADPEKMKTVFSLLDRMCENLQLYQLICNQKKDAAVTAYDGMQTEE